MLDMPNSEFRTLTPKAPAWAQLAPSRRRAMRTGFMSRRRGFPVASTYVLMQ